MALTHGAVAIQWRHRLAPEDMDVKSGRFEGLAVFPRCATFVVFLVAAGCPSAPKPWSPFETTESDCRFGDITCGDEDGFDREREADQDALKGDAPASDTGTVDEVFDLAESADSDGQFLDDSEMPDLSGDHSEDVDEKQDASEVHEVLSPTCLNGICEPTENKENCPADCCSPCGDGICDGLPPCEETCPEDCCFCGDGQCGQCPGMPPETVSTCSEDCSTCGDGICSGKESALTGSPNQCVVDCCGSCGDKSCKGGECHEDDPNHEEYCLKDCDFACGNGLCEGGESPADCPQDCEKFACGNHFCEPGENPEACPQDCSGSCGDCQCDMGESNETCPIDCGYCGDGVCSTCSNLNETTQFCPQDCCADGNSCTDDISILLDGGFTCGHVVNDLADCEMDLPCTTGDFCEAGKCISGSQAATCNDGNPCTSDWCNQATGSCQFDPDAGGECEDNDPCTSGDKCEQGECKPGDLDDCDDGNQCTADACFSSGPITGCVNQPKDDGTVCNKEPCGGNGACLEALCVCL